MAKSNKVRLVIYFILLLLVSLGKDLFTPDYLNTPTASFLQPNQNNGLTDIFIHHPGFWVLSFLYSVLFIILPFLIIRIIYKNQMAMFSLWILMALALTIYLMAWSQIDFLQHHILPKFNRYFHSPILTFILVAIFNINKRTNHVNR